MTGKQKNKNNYIKRFAKQLIISALIFAVLMIPGATNNQALKKFRQKAKDIIFCEIDYQDIKESIKQIIKKITIESGDKQNENTDRTYPDA